MFKNKKNGCVESYCQDFSLSGNGGRLWAVAHVQPFLIPPSEPLYVQHCRGTFDLCTLFQPHLLPGRESFSMFTCNGIRLVYAYVTCAIVGRATVIMAMALQGSNNPRTYALRCP